MGTGRPEEALETLQRLERDFPAWRRMEEAFYLQGNILYFHRNDIPNAIERWNARPEGQPELPARVHHPGAPGGDLPERDRRHGRGGPPVEVRHPALPQRPGDPPLPHEPGRLLRQAGPVRGRPAGAEEPPDPGVSTNTSASRPPSTSRRSTTCGSLTRGARHPGAGGGASALRRLPPHRPADLQPTSWRSRKTTTKPLIFSARSPIISCHNRRNRSGSPGCSARLCLRLHDPDR